MFEYIDFTSAEKTIALGVTSLNLLMISS